MRETWSGGAEIKVHTKAEEMMITWWWWWWWRWWVKPTSPSQRNSITHPANCNAASPNLLLCALLTWHVDKTNKQFIFHHFRGCLLSAPLLRCIVAIDQVRRDRIWSQNFKESHEAKRRRPRRDNKIMLNFTMLAVIQFLHDNDAYFIISKIRLLCARYVMYRWCY